MRHFLKPFSIMPKKALCLRAWISCSEIFPYPGDPQADKFSYLALETYPGHLARENGQKHGPRLPSEMIIVNPLRPVRRVGFAVLSSNSMRGENTHSNRKRMVVDRPIRRDVVTMPATGTTGGKGVIVGMDKKNAGLFIVACFSINPR